MAAAHAKEILLRIPPNKVEEESKVNNLILVSLTGYQYFPGVVLACRLLGQTGTGQRSLNLLYQTWFKISKQTLFYPSIPGAGETILTSIIIDSNHTLELMKTWVSPRVTAASKSKRSR
jgi:hypothetical protein